MSGRPTIVFAGGGTGGHLYPALAVAEVLRARLPRARIVFFGSDRQVDRMILDATPCELIPQVVPRFTRQFWRWPVILGHFRRAYARCRLWLREHGADVVVGSGGAVSVPVVLAARKEGVPALLFNPDALPGRANRFLARRVRRVLVQWEESVGHFPKGVEVRVTGCPVRRPFLDAARPPAYERFGLDPRRKTLLVTGASLGARSVNLAVAALLPRLQCFDDWQVLHLTGEVDHQRVRAAYAASSVRSVVLAYTHDMPDAIRLAELVVARAGASTLAELIAAGKASVLMPYPHHRDMHQLANARILSDHGAAVIVQDRVEPDSNVGPLASALEPLMRDEDARRRMGEAARRIARLDAAEVVADEILNQLGSTRHADIMEIVKTSAEAAR